jgi:hypothetical protein
MLPINENGPKRHPAFFSSFVRDSVDVPRQKGKNATRLPLMSMCLPPKSISFPN